MYPYLIHRRESSFQVAAPGPVDRNILEGHPINGIFSDLEMEQYILPHPFFCSSTVSIPGEVVDPMTIYNLTKLNHLLINVRHDFFHGAIQPAYIQGLQRELDMTSAASLREKLDSIYFRELGSLSNTFTEWYRSFFGAPYPGNFFEEYSRQCYENYLRTLDAPSPLEQFEIVPLIDMHIGNFYFSFTNPSLFMLLTLTFFLLLIYFVTKKGGKVFSSLIHFVTKKGGKVFSSLIHSVARNPSLAKQSFSYTFLGFALTEAIALFAPMMAFLILFVFLFFISMSTHHILGLKKVSRVRLFADSSGT